MSLWNGISSIVVVVSMDKVSNPVEFKMELDAKLEGKVGLRKIILVTDEKIKKEELREVKGITYLSTKDTNFFGKLKNENFFNDLQNSFDACLILDSVPEKIEKQILKLKAHWKVGVNTNLKILTINLKSESNDLFEMVNFAKNTLKQITG